jgi:monoamine oxidase
MPSTHAAAGLPLPRRRVGRRTGAVPQRGITTNMDLSTIWYPSYGYLGRRGTLIGYYNFGPNAEACGKLTPAERRARAVAQGRKIHGPPTRPSSTRLLGRLAPHPLLPGWLGLLARAGQR